MADSSSGSGSPQDAASLLLNVIKRDGSRLEYYLADGLTIGRMRGNTIVIADELQCDRLHARIEFGADGQAQLRCSGSDVRVQVGSALANALTLSTGTAFSIGETRFECVAGRRQSLEPAKKAVPICPYCKSETVSAKRNEVVPCESCQQPVIVLEFGRGLAPLLIVPAIYGKYMAQSFVARGGMGVVLRGVEVTPNDEPAVVAINAANKRSDNGQSVAIKLLLPTKVSAHSAQRFKQEIALMQRIRHENVVGLLTAGRAEKFNYLVMRWIEGQTFSEIIAENGKNKTLPSFERVLPWLKQACKGLAAIHTVGITHRDIKPSNLLLESADNRVYISDLGIGKHVDAEQTAITQTGELPGTREYMSPEQFTNPDQVDHRTDLYSLGVTFYELLCGHRPVGAWHSISAVNSTVPAEFDNVLVRLLKRKPEDRFADVHELLACLTPLDLRPETSRPVGQPDHTDTETKDTETKDTETKDTETKDTETKDDGKTPGPVPPPPGGEEEGCSKIFDWLGKAVLICLFIIGYALSHKNRPKPPPGGSTPVGIPIISPPEKQATKESVLKGVFEEVLKEARKNTMPSEPFYITPELSLVTRLSSIYNMGLVVELTNESNAPVSVSNLNVLSSDGIGYSATGEVPIPSMETFSISWDTIDCILLEGDVLTFSTGNEHRQCKHTLPNYPRASIYDSSIDFRSAWLVNGKVAEVKNLSKTGVLLLDKATVTPYSGASRTVELQFIIPPGCIASIGQLELQDVALVSGDKLNLFFNGIQQPLSRVVP